MTKARDQLKHLAQAYFHQDYDLEAQTPLGVVRLFREGEPEDAISELKAEIRTILNSPMTDQEIYDLWVRQYGASYDPTSDGEGYRSWFTKVLSELDDS
jgi:CdiI immunity protein